jgi:hypothetical protein
VQLLLSKELLQYWDRVVAVLKGDHPLLEVRDCWLCAVSLIAVCFACCAATPGLQGCCLHRSEACPCCLRYSNASTSRALHLPHQHLTAQTALHLLPSHPTTLLPWPQVMELPPLDPSLQQWGEAPAAAQAPAAAASGAPQADANGDAQQEAPQQAQQAQPGKELTEVERIERDQAAAAQKVAIQRAVIASLATDPGELPAPAGWMGCAPVVCWVCAPGCGVAAAP